MGFNSAFKGLNVARERKAIAHTCLIRNTPIISAKRKPIFVVVSSSSSSTKTSVSAQPAHGTGSIHKQYLCFLRYTWPVNGPDHDQQHCYHHAPTVKPEAATAVVELLMMGVMTPETC
jgi:hypothetical protein